MIIRIIMIARRLLATFVMLVSHRDPTRRIPDMCVCVYTFILYTKQYSKKLTKRKGMTLQAPAPPGLRANAGFVLLFAIICQHSANFICTLSAGPKPPSPYSREADSDHGEPCMIQ